MSRLSPTKSNLLRLKREIQFAREGYDLLEQKRQVLVLEIMRYVEQAKRLEAVVREHMREAHVLLKEALLRSGNRAMISEGLGTVCEHSVNVDHRRVMGISLPVLSVTLASLPVHVGTGMGLFAREQTSHAFLKALEAIGRLAEAQATILRLARELRKTQRRVNALDKVFIPGHEQSIHQIESTLEEREREEHVVLRKIRERGVAGEGLRLFHG